MADRDGVANTGYIGELHLHSPPAARSGNAAKVAEIAPGDLLDRGTELADMTSFCTADQVDVPYLWWRAPAWAGKSALLSWFVVHPPAGIRIVSFFVTARYAAQNDRIAFAEVVIEQLSEILGEPMPDLKDATRDGCLLTLLNRAALACAERSERLVLVVDGLDEDRGVFAGPDAHSIAALLPARPPAGMRILVSGRPDPPVPADVRDSHPLRDSRAIRSLVASEHAKVVREDAERELDRLLDGTRTEQDLLGLLAASGGGLSAADLAAITGLAVRQVGKQLDAVTGRTFSRRPGQWPPDTDVYLLAHEELQVRTLAALNGGPLDGYRQRLHVWADGYRSQGWPLGTPEYLLRGYFEMLYDTGDIDRMVRVTTDASRQHRLLDTVGGDAATERQINDALVFAAAQEAPTLSNVLILALHRNALIERNRAIPPELPALWATLGHHTRAEALAQSITEEHSRDDAWHALAGAVAATGESDRAETMVLSIRDPNRQAAALSDLAAAIAATGDTVRGETIAASIGDPYYQVKSLAAIARTAGPARATALIEQAVAVASSISSTYYQTTALHSVADAMTAAGQSDRAAALFEQTASTARAQSHVANQAPLLVIVARAAARAGAGRLAVELVEECEIAVRAIAEEQLLDHTLGELAVAFADTGAPDRAVVVAAGICDPLARAYALCAVAGLIAAGGDREAALGVAESAEALARSHIDPYAQALVLSVVAQTIAAAGNSNKAQCIAASITIPDSRCEALAAVAATIAASGDPDRAEVTADMIVEAQHKAIALTSIARAVAESGDHARALGLAKAAETLARIVPRQQRETGLTMLVKAVTSAGDCDRAELIADSITDPYQQTHALTTLVEAAVEAGRPDRAQLFTGRAEVSARSIENPLHRSLAWSRLATTIAASDEPHRATEFTRQAQIAARTVDDPHRRAFILRIATEGMPVAENAPTTVDPAASFSDPQQQTGALCQSAQSAASAGDAQRAETLVEHAWTAARTITDPHTQSRALVEVARAASSAGCAGLAEAVAHSIGDPHSQAMALMSAARSAVPDRAKKLIAMAMVHGHWAWALDVAVRVDPVAVFAVADDPLSRS